MRWLITFLLNSVFILSPGNAKELNEIENTEISSWWTESKFGSLPKDVSVLWMNETENKEFCAHLKIVFKNDFSRGGNAIVCNAPMKNFFSFEKFQRGTLADKSICIKFEDVGTVIQLISCIREVELQLKMKSVAEQKSPRCYDVPDIVPQVIVWKVTADSYIVVKVMEKIEPIEVKSKRVGHTFSELHTFQSNKMQVERFLIKHGTCAEDIFDFFLNLQEKNLFPIDLKVSNMGFVTGRGGLRHEISKLMFFDLGDNHFLATAGTWTPAVIRSQFGQSYSSFNIVGVPDAHAFNPIFFELHILLLELCFASQNFVVTQNKDFRGEEFRQVKFLCRKREECLRKNPSFKPVFQKLSNRFKAMKRPVKKLDGEEFAFSMKKYACE